MAASPQPFDLELGALDLAPFLRVAQGEGFDPADPDFSEPQLSRSPLREGAELVLDNVGPKELVWPLALDAHPQEAVNLAPNPRPAGAGASTAPWVTSGYAWYLNAGATIASNGGPSSGLPADGTYFDVTTPGSASFEGAVLPLEPPVGGWVAGNIYKVRLYLHPRTGVGALAIFLGHLTGADGTATTVVTPTGWTVVELTFTAVNTTGLVVAVRTNTAQARIFAVSMGQVEKVASAGVALAPYFDGDTEPNLQYEWDGPPYASASRTRSGKDGLHRMISEINLAIEAAKDDGTAIWRDLDATERSHFDVIAGRLEPDFNYRRSARDWGQALLRLWVQPYAHTGTWRIVATGVGSGLVLTVPLPAVAGDVDADMFADVRLTQGAIAYQQFGLVAVLPTSSYAPHYGVASMSRGVGAGTVVDSEIVGSVAIGLSVASGVGTIRDLCRATLPNPAAYLGHNRLLAAVRSAVASGGAHIWAERGDGTPLGPTQALPALYGGGVSGWEMVDLGVLHVAGGSDMPDNQSITLRISRVAGGTQVASPGVRMGGLVIVPEHTTTLMPSINPFPSDAHFLDSRTQDSWVRSFNRGQPVKTAGWRRGAIPRVPPAGGALAIVAANFNIRHALSVQVKVRERFAFAA